MPHALIVNADLEAARRLASEAARGGYTTACAATLLDARRQLALQPASMLLLSAQLPDGSGLALLEESDLVGAAEVVLMTADARPAQSPAEMGAQLPSRMSAPFPARDRHRPIASVATPCTFEQVRGALAVGPSAPPADRLGLLVGRSPLMQAVYRQIQRVAPTQFTVFITGESGTGKELAARTLHDLSRRRQQPFVAVNCGALSPHLVESEMFGHERGSFTGAERQHPGFFEQARGGTLLLDEITEMPLAMQVKLLRVLESGSFTRVGATSAQQADVRVVAASNREPGQAVAQGLLREDLFWRLNVFPLAMPPLRERREDIPLLATQLLAQIAQSEGQARQLDAEGLATLAGHDWPGNVRELRNVLKRAWVLGEGPWLEPSLLAPQGLEAVESLAHATARTPMKQEAAPVVIPLGTSLAEAERRVIEATLRHHGHRREQAAATLGVSLKTLYNRLRAYGGDRAG